MKNFFLTSIAILLSLLSFGQGTEDFANCGTASSYGTRSWNGTTASWTATDARADQTINGKAITVRNGSLTSTSTITGGIKKLTVSTQLKFSGSSGTFDLEINGNVVSTIAYSASVQTIIVDNIDISGNVVISFTNNSSSSNRVAFDDLSWTAYTAPTGPVITLTSSNVASEAAGTVITLTATADQLLSANGTIDLDISGTGITLTDYSLSNTTITIPSGSSIGTATLTILDDSDVEGTETLIATILNPSTGLFIGTPNNQAITITDNDFNPDVNLSADLSAGTEVGQTVITLTATATYAVTGNQTVDLVVTGTGITGTDFVLSSSQITILNGQTTGTATFTIADDSDLEGPETATIAISNPSTGITIVSPTSVTVDIADDDLIIYDLIINEVLADPASGADVNNDGNASTSEDEFIEIYNNENNSIDLSGYTISDAVAVRHTFPDGTILPSNSFITVFGGGNPTNIPGIVQIASTGLTGFNNGSETITLKDSLGNTVAEINYSSSPSDQSLARYIDFTGPYVDHSTIPVIGRTYSPGQNNEATYPIGIMSGDGTICSAGESTNISVIITGISGPYSLVYSNGITTSTISSYASGSPITVSPIAASTTYSIVSINGSSIGHTGSATVTVGALAPSVTSNPTGISNIMTWTAISGAGYYYFEYRKVGETVWNSAGTSAGTTRTIYNLYPSTNYELRARTYCSNYTSGAWSTSSFTTTAGPACQIVPTCTAAGASTSLTISWTPIAGPAYYYVEYKLSNATAWLNGGTTINSSRTIYSLVSGNYDVRVRSHCSNYSSGAWSNVVNATVSAISCHITPALSATGGSSSIIANWISNGATYYYVEYKLTSSSTWISGGTTIGTNRTIPNLVNGNYDVRVRSHCADYSSGLWSTIMSVFVGDVPTPLNEKSTLAITDKSLKEQSFKFETRVFPNPFSDVLFVELLSAETNNPISIYIYDAAGRMIETKQLNITNERIFELGVNYSPGIYQMHVIQNKNKTITRFVKQ